MIFRCDERDRRAAENIARGRNETISDTLRRALRELVAVEAVDDYTALRPPERRS